MDWGGNLLEPPCGCRMPERTNKRDGVGVKTSADLYRTFKGAPYVCWRSDATAAQIAAYRVAGVRCARRGVELFVHHADQDKAAQVDGRPA
jgi:hypothetical protein